MIDATADTKSVQMPAVYSQGFALVSVLAYADPYSTGPLAVPADNDTCDDRIDDYDDALKPVA